MFFKKKNKTDTEIELQKANKKKGCLKSFIIGVVALVFIGIVVVFSVRDSLKLFGVNLKTFNEYVSWLNEEVDESKLTTNPISGNSYLTFKEKAEASGLEIFDNNGNVSLNYPSINISANLTVYDYELGAMINNASTQEDGGQVFSLLELSITQVSENVFSLKTVVRFDLTEIKKEVGSYANKLPNKIYITSVGECFTVGSRVQARNNSILINQLSEEKNDKIVSFLNEIDKEVEDDEIMSIVDINNYIVTEILTSLCQKTNTTPLLNQSTFSMMLKSSTN